MKKFLFICVLFVFSFSCKNDKRNVRLIKGDWKLVKYKQMDKYGFLTEYEASGKFHFDSYKISDKNGTYSYSLIYKKENIDIELTRSGNYYSDKKQRSFFLSENKNNVESWEQFKISFLGKEDAILEHQDSTIFHTFVLEKE